MQVIPGCKSCFSSLLCLSYLTRSISLISRYFSDSPVGIFLQVFWRCFITCFVDHWEFFDFRILRYSWLKKMNGESGRFGGTSFTYKVAQKSQRPTVGSLNRSSRSSSRLSSFYTGCGGPDIPRASASGSLTSSSGYTSSAFSSRFQLLGAIFGPLLASSAFCLTF